MDNSIEQGRLLETAQVLYTEYIRKKSKKKTIVGRPARLDQAWVKTAAVVHSLHAIPEEYIEAQFKLAKASLFPNMMYGRQAQQRYKQYCIQQRRTVQDVDDMSEEAIDQAYSASNERPAEAMLRHAISDTYAALKYYCHSQDLNDPAVMEQVLKMYLFFDPVCVLLLSPIPEYKEVFGVRAQAELRNKPALRQAAVNAGFDIAVEYIEEEEDYDG